MLTKRIGSASRDKKSIEKPYFSALLAKTEKHGPGFLANNIGMNVDRRFLEKDRS